MPTDLVIRIGLVLLSIGLTPGCEARRLPKAGEVLRHQPESRAPGVRLRAPLGSRAPSSVVVALVPEERGCDRVERARGEVFFVCLWPSPGQSSAERLRTALGDLKRSFPAHVAAGPVSVFVAGSRTRDGMDLAAEEPSFFSGLVLEQADKVLVSNTRLFAYGQKGGKKVALLGVPVEEGQRARGMAGSAHLSIETFPPGAEGLAAALRFARVPPEAPPLPPDSRNH